MRTAASLLLLAGLLCPAESLAVELWGTGPLASSTLLVNSESYIRYRHTDEKLENFEDRNILDYVEQVQRLNLSLTKDGLTIGAQLDEVALFGNRYILDGELYHERDLYDASEILSPFPDALVRLEKLYLQQRWGGTTITVGDTYGSFGRGAALNVVKNGALDIDTSIRGARAEVSAGDLGVVLISGLTNRQQINRLNVNVDLDQDIPHMISGARVEHYALGPLMAGVHGTVARFGREADADLPGLLRYEEDLDAAIAGANVEALGILGVDWYLEGDLFRYFTPELSGEDEPTTGGLLYASASAYPAGLVLLVEGKYSKDTERVNAFLSTEGWELSAPPTLEYERVITEDSSAAVNSNELYGGRARVDVPLADGDLLPYLSLSVFQDNDTTGLHFNSSPETIYHPTFGAQWLPGGNILIFNGGYRRDIRELASEGADQLAHFDGEFSTHLFGEEHLEIAVSVKRFLWGDNPQGQEDFLEMENALVWKRGEKLDFILYQDWSNNPLIPSIGNITENVYGALEVKYKPSSSSAFTALVGAYKAGIRCSGGQCRTLPGFEGAQMTYTTQF